MPKPRRARGREGCCPAEPRGPGDRSLAAACPGRRFCAGPGDGARPPAQSLCRRARRPRPIPAPRHSFFSRSEGSGGWGAPGQFASQRGAFSLVSTCRGGLAFTHWRRGQAQGGDLGSRVPGQPPSARSGPIVPPPATRFCLWPEAGGGPALGRAVRSCGRSDQVPRAPTR